MKLGTWGSPELLRTCLTVYSSILSECARARAHTHTHTHRHSERFAGKCYYGLNDDS